MTARIIEYAKTMSKSSLILAIATAAAFILFIALFSIPGFFFFIGIAVFIGSLNWIRIKMMIENIPTSKIRSLAMGLVEIKGGVVPAKGKWLKAPFSGKDCVYYDYLVQRKRNRGSDWAGVAYGSEKVIFYLRDETGMVLVDPDKASIEVGNYFEIKDADLPEHVKEFLEAKRIPLVDPAYRSRMMRFVEHSIPLNEKLYILGTAGDNPFVEEASSIHSVSDIMIKKGEHDKFYFISDKPEKTFLKKIKGRIISGFIFSAIAILLFLPVILRMLGLV